MAKQGKLIGIIASFIVHFGDFQSVISFFNVKKSMWELTYVALAKQGKLIEINATFIVHFGDLQSVTSFSTPNKVCENVRNRTHCIFKF